jgi:hypothetical protein
VLRCGPAQVMAEASDTCLHSLFYYVHNPRMLRTLMEHATKEKAGKVRASCQEYVRRVLVEWTAPECERHGGLEALEECIKVRWLA